MSRIMMGVLGVEVALLGWLLSRQLFAQLPPPVKPEVATIAPATNISGAVLPHHDMVEPQRREFLSALQKKASKPETIILASPNHPDVGSSDIQTSDHFWQLGQGEISPEISIINSLSGSGTARIDPAVIEEAGLRAVLGDIKQYFPAAKLVPVTIKSTTSFSEIEKLNSQLVSSCTKCLMLTSVDFSHYQPALLANLHDELTINALKALDTQTLFNKSEVDSPAALALLTLWANSHQTKSLNIVNHTNSGLLLNDKDIESTSHLYAWYEAGKPALATASVSFTIGGDAFFDRMIASTHLKNGLWHAFDQLGDRIFWGADAGAINLEGPISASPVIIDTSPTNMSFNFPPDTVAALKYLKINSASLANNHTSNAGAAALANTRAVLEKASIAPFGGPTGVDITKVARFAGQGLNLYFIGVNILAGSPDLAPTIKELKADSTNRVIVFPHWGNEYQTKHSSQQSLLAHQWITAGADAVIGSHTHVIQDMEVYNDRPVIYSLGNLLFDQTFSRATQQGLLISGQFTSDKLALFALPHETLKYKPQLMTGSAKSAVLQTLYQDAGKYLKDTPAGQILEFALR